MMRRVFVAAVLLFLAANAAAYTKFQFDVTDGSTTAVASLSGTTTKVLKACPGATVAVYLTGTSTLATLYSTAAGAAKSNPFTASNSARATFWIASGTYDFAFSGGGCSTHTWTGMTAGADSLTVSVTGMGAACDGVTDDWAVFQAAASLSGAHRIELPAAACLITNEILITQALVSWVGQGKQTSQINLVPTVDNKAALHFDAAGAAVYYQGAVRDLTIKSTDTTYRKFAIRCTDCSEFDVENVAIFPFEGGPDISPFTGGSSSGLYLEGRELGSFRNIEISADIPIRIGPNPNEPTIDADHYHFDNIYLLAQGSTPNVWIESGVDLAHVTFDGHQAWVLGKWGLYWVDTTSTVGSFNLTIANLRYEQPIARGWMVEIQTNVVLRGFRLINVLGGSLTTIDGVKLRKVRRVLLESYTYNGTGVALDVDSTVTEGLDGRLVTTQTGGSASITGLTKVWSYGPPITGSPLWQSFHYEATAGSNFTAGYCYELMGLNKCAGSGTLANTAAVAIPSLGGVAGLLGRVTVVVSGATKHASCTVSYDATQAQVEATSNAAVCTAGTTAGAFNVHWSSAAVIELLNSTGESVKYWYEVTQIP